MRKRVRDWWQALARALEAPGIDEAELAGRMTRARRDLPVPVFWLLGKAQAGKTAVIRALTGETAASIGDGFRPCTRHARLYDYPDPTLPLVRFLDTRGLGETGYDPAADLERFSSESQLVMAVMNVADPAQGPVRSALENLRRQRPRWPVLVVQTQLHQLYPDIAFGHPLPYPFETDRMPGSVPPELVEALQAQRAWPELAGARCVAVDFTLPEDGYEPAHYGLEALWSAIEDVLPLGLRRLLGREAAITDLYARRADALALTHAVAAASADLAPVPAVAVPLVLAIQARLCHGLARLYGQPLDRRRWGEISAALGGGMMAHMGGRQLAKLVPGYGPVVAAAGTGASTWALGKALAWYFGTVREGAAPDPATIARVYAAELDRGREMLLDRIRRP